MPVFVSHQRADEASARHVAAYLSIEGIKNYLDVLDPALKDATAVTGIILANIRKCTHLLAVVTPATSQSWWVPFEIGVATEGDRRIATYGATGVSLPEYLRVWPVLTNQDGLAKYAALYKKDGAVVESRGPQSFAKSFSINSAADFHSTLKRQLGQS
jgi:TIR domain